MARLRAEGRITEIGAGDLALTRAEAALLLRDAEVTLDDGDVAELHQRTEGWAAGLYLAALYLREGGALTGAAGSFSGGDRLVSEYVEAELLARISERQRVFLTRTAVLDRMCGPLCDAVLELSGSAATLADLARSNLLLVPLDRRGQWYRYHHLFRDMLLAELERLEPDRIPVLRRRAATWCLHNDLVEASLEYSIAAGDVDQAARLVGSLFLVTYRQGRVGTLQRWFRWLDERGGIEGHPMVALWAAYCRHVDRAAGRGRAVGRRGRSLATRRAGREPMTRPPRRGPLCCGPCCVAAGWSRCAPTPTKPRAGSRRRTSRRRRPRSFKVSRGSSAVTSMPATPTSRTRSASGTWARPMCSRMRCASGRWSR